MKAIRWSLNIFQKLQRRPASLVILQSEPFEVQNYKIIFSWELTKNHLGDEKADILDTIQ